jgi:hypothetical protein
MTPLLDSALLSFGSFLVVCRGFDDTVSGRGEPLDSGFAASTEAIII